MPKNTKISFAKVSFSYSSPNDLKSFDIKENQILLCNPIFFRICCTCISTVRVSPINSYPHTVASKRSLVSAMSWFCRKKARISNSFGVKLMRLCFFPLYVRQYSWYCPQCMVLLLLCFLRSTTSILANNSTVSNGFTI